MVALSLLALGCSEGQAVPEQLAIKDDQAAHALVEKFFTIYVDVKTRDLVEMMCERDPATRAMAESFVRQSQSPKSPFRIERFRVVSVEPGWSTSARPEPLYWVTVAFPRTSRPGEIEQRLRINAADGCVEGFLTQASGPPASMPSAPKAPPVETPPAPPPDETAPVSDDDEVIEL